MGTYPPRECGIATFNQDLLNSSQMYLGENVVCKAVALNLSPLDTYIYPSEVEWTIDQNNKKEYADLAKKLNSDPNIKGIMIQHEYGIYGGEEGENILSFIENCKKPIVVTFHTILPNPSPKMKVTTLRIIKKAKNVVVLTQSSKVLLETLYPESVNKVYVIPHGIHPTAFSDTLAAKKKLGIKNSTVISTFGLLSRGKGIEYVIRSLPRLIKKHPSVLYLVLGETHPVVRRSEGESYRNELSRLVTKLGLKKHVKFYDQYLSLSDLIEFLKATDIYISTSINSDQAVSGTLSYALGVGRAVISTEFAQAKEIITPESGRLIPFKNSDAYHQALNELLVSKSNLKKMHRAAYDQTRPMLWSNVAFEYSKLLKQNIAPKIKVSHLAAMTDKFGLFQFAKFNLPDKKFGYTLDDNSRALVVCSQMISTSGSNKKIEALMGIYLNFIEKCQRKDGKLINYIGYPSKVATAQNKNENLEEATARAMWALSEVVSNSAIDEKNRDRAKKIFLSALPHTKKFIHIRPIALLIKAFAIFASVYPTISKELSSDIRVKAEVLLARLEKNSDKNWFWFDDYLGYNNGVLPEALLIAGKTLGNKKYTDKGLSALNFLIDKTFVSNRYMPIGHSEWYKRGGIRSTFDQQPEDPASMTLALVTAYQITHNESYKSLADICFSWFLGNNILQMPLYNFENGGCYDGLHPDRVNLNQGAESQVSYLLARLSLEKLKNNENSSDQKYLPRH